MATFLQIVQQAAKEFGLPIPSTMQTNDPQTMQLGALANAAGESFRDEHEWTPLQLDQVIEFGGPINITADMVQGSRVLTNVLPNTAGIVPPNFTISGQGTQIAARVQSVDNLNQLTMTEVSDITQANVPLMATRDTFEFASDFERFVDQTAWDRRNQWTLLGPVSPQMDQWQRSGVVTTGPRLKWRQVGVMPVAFRVWPPPNYSGAYPGTLVFTYISKNWVRKEDGSGYQEMMVADGDTPLFSSTAIRKDMKWRFFQAKGFTYAALQQEAIDYVNSKKGHDGGQRILALNRRIPGFLITPAQVQDGSYPGPGN